MLVFEKMYRGIGIAYAKLQLQISYVIHTHIDFALP